MEKFTRPLSLVELETATNNFDNENIIGYGNMGIMYKAMFPNSLLLAVKRLHKFESFEKEFLLEIEILGRLRHTNLVPLLGFCYEKDKKFLVYKYMSNGTLHHWLHGSSPQVEVKKMGWPISSRCIVLDYDFEPKISKFSNTKMMVNASGTSLSSSTFVVPDCSPYKENVYSFGILLLELVTCREPSTWINSLADRSREVIMFDENFMEQGFRFVTKYEETGKNGRKKGKVVCSSTKTEWGIKHASSLSSLSWCHWDIKQRIFVDFLVGYSSN
ncbi:probably inactive leucine-rich repeat receptor-like protein kinase [Tanacetum coccineum]